VVGAVGEGGEADGLDWVVSVVWECVWKGDVRVAASTIVHRDQLLCLKN